jgi:hypothetical protein
MYKIIQNLSQYALNEAGDVMELDTQEVLPYNVKSGGNPALKLQTDETFIRTGKGPIKLWRRFTRDEMKALFNKYSAKGVTFDDVTSDVTVTNVTHNTDVNVTKQESNVTNGEQSVTNVTFSRKTGDKRNSNKRNNVTPKKGAGNSKKAEKSFKSDVTEKTSVSEIPGKTKKGVPCKINGVTYVTMVDAAEALGLSVMTIRRRINSGVPGYERAND